MADEIWTISYGETAVRLLVATLLGGLVGWEREHNNHPAGLRTHILVCVGSTLIMLLSIYGFPQFMGQQNVRFDPGRIAAQVVSGVGFLGAGTILRQGMTISGLTTAASLWVVAAIGLAAGAGFHFPAILTTLLVLASLELLNRLEGWLFHRQLLKRMRIQVTKQPKKLGELATVVGSMGIDIKKVQMDEGEEEEPEIEILFILRIPHQVEPTELLDRVQEVPGVKSVRLD